MDSNLAFTLSKFEEIGSTFSSDEKKLIWLNNLCVVVYSIYRDYNDIQLYSLLLKHNLLNRFPPYDNSNSGVIFLSASRISMSKFSEFLLYLRDDFIPYIVKENLKLDYSINGQKYLTMIKEGNISEGRKYPVLYFNYSLIEYYSDLYFNDLKDKIDYYEYVLMKFKMFKSDPKNDYEISEEDYEIQIKLLNPKLEYLKSKYERDSKILSVPIPQLKKEKPKSKPKNKKSNNGKQHFETNKLVWLGSKKQLISLLRGLQEYDFIINNIDKDPECEKMVCHFVDKDNKPFTNVKSSAKIRLGKNISDLLYVYQNLAFVNNKLLSDDLIWIKTEKIFTKRDGSKLDNKRLSASYHQLSDMERPALDDIINNVYKT